MPDNNWIERNKRKIDPWSEQISLSHMAFVFIAYVFYKVECRCEAKTETFTIAWNIAFIVASDRTIAFQTKKSNFQNVHENEHFPFSIEECRSFRFFCCSASCAILSDNSHEPPGIQLKLEVQRKLIYQIRSNTEIGLKNGSCFALCSLLVYIYAPKETSMRQ